MPIIKPWLIHPGHVDVAREIELAARRGDPQALRTDSSELSGHAMPKRLGKVGVLNVHGPIVPNATLESLFLSYLFGGTVLESFSAGLKELAADDSVESIALHFDSPGGQVAGVHEAADLIASVASEKPVVAYASGMCCSAAYWLASAATRIAASPTAEVGSIGAVIVTIDDSVLMSRIGVKERVFRSRVSPKKWANPFAEDEAEAEAASGEIQATVDAYGDAFVAAVASNRKVSRKKVLSDFGQGGTMLGPAAVEAGMVDAVGTFDSLVAQLGRRRARKASPGKMAHARTRRHGEA